MSGFKACKDALGSKNKKSSTAPTEQNPDIPQAIPVPDNNYPPQANPPTYYPPQANPPTYYPPQANPSNYSPSQQ